MAIAQGDRNRVYSGAFNSGVGSNVIFSQDNGQTYEMRELEYGPMIYAGAAAAGSQALLAGHTVGIFNGVHNSVDGGSTWRPWLQPMEFPISTTQSCELVPNRANERNAWFGCVGTFPGGQDGIMRVIFTEDNGETFQRTEFIERRLRYGAYPTRDTWYLSGGTWPGLTPREGIHEFGWGFQMQTKKTANGNVSDSRLQYVHGTGPEAHLNADPKDFTAFVYKTTDRGATWTKIFDRPSQGFYPQYIACPNERQCWMSAEGSIGAMVFHTSDGGATWSEQLVLRNDPQTRYHFYPIVMLNDREGWVAGSKAVFPTMEGIIYRTLDGGSTWVEQPSVPGMMIYNMDIKAIGGALYGHGMFVSWPEQASGTIVLRQ